MTIKLAYDKTEKFSQLLRKLSKRYRTLPEDLEIVKKAAIELLHVKTLDNQSCYKLQGFSTEPCEIYKVKKFACKALRGTGNRSGMRLIYAYHPQTAKVVFLDIYYKGVREDENNQLITEYLKELQNE